MDADTSEQEEKTSGGLIISDTEVELERNNYPFIPYSDILAMVVEKDSI